MPPTTDPGDLVIEDKVAAVTVRVALALTPSVAVTTELLVDGTPKVVTVNVVDVLPAGTVTLAGTVAAAALLVVSATVAPPAGAVTFSRTVPVEVLPPTTLVGLSETEETATVGFTVSVALKLAP